MPYLIMKSGVPIFDVARAYGLAALLSYSDEDESTNPIINDAGSCFVIDFPIGKPSPKYLRQNTGWHGLFSLPQGLDPRNQAWNSLFVTDLSQEAKEKKVKQVQKQLEEEFDDLLRIAQTQGLIPRFEGETLPGGLEPSAFKGSKSSTRAQYAESQTDVDKNNWALACLGGALVGRYIWQRRNIFAVYPVPEKVHFITWQDIREKTYSERLDYLGIRNAVAHYSVVLAETIRQMAASSSSFSDSFSSLAYFSLFKTGNQWKPSSAGFLNLQPLMELALEHTHESAKVFEVWKNLFRRTNERYRLVRQDLAECLTNLVMNPSLENLEKHNRILLRYVGKKEVKTMNLYTEDTLKEVMQIV